MTVRPRPFGMLLPFGRKALLAALGLIWAVQAYAGPPGNDYAEPGSRTSEMIRYDWVDQQRRRPVPVTIYYPGTGGPWPVIVFSHGLGGTRDSYDYLGRHWAGHGFISIHPQHQGSDDEVWRDKERPVQELRRSVEDPKNSLERPADVKFVLDRLTLVNREEGPLQGRLDLNRAGAAGHSFGAYTTLAVAGQLFIGPLGRELSFPEPRIKAAVIMSAPVGAAKKHPDRSFERIGIPCLHLTGDKDYSPIDPNTKPGDRRLPFDHIQDSDQYLVVFRGGDHMVFAGRRLHKSDPQDPYIHRLIRMSTTAFWQAYLKEDQAARDFLVQGDGLLQALDGLGTLEKKARF
ncbi:MAG: acetylhydrolase [Thermodesulfobacteriota bacterium]